MLSLFCIQNNRKIPIWIWKNNNFRNKPSGLWCSSKTTILDVATLSRVSSIVPAANSCTKSTFASWTFFPPFVFFSNRCFRGDNWMGEERSRWQDLWKFTCAECTEIFLSYLWSKKLIWLPVRHSSYCTNQWISNSSPLVSNFVHKFAAKDAFCGQEME